MYAKLKISADLTLLTGLHIGGSNEFSAIGTVDSPVVRDPLTGLPLIPGSSLKGKLRTLLVRSIKQAIALNEPAADPDEVLRLFGSSKPKANEKRPARSRLQFSDIFLTNRTQREQTGITEVKFESTISRATAVANPRQIERVVRGSVFGFVCIYDAEDPAQLEQDFQNIANALRLLQMDYLGGHGTRGYGKVKFSNLAVTCVSGEVEAAALQQLNTLFKEVEQDELLSI